MGFLTAASEKAEKDLLAHVTEAQASLAKLASTLGGEVIELKDEIVPSDAVAVPKTLLGEIHDHLKSLADDLAGAPKELVDKIMSLIPAPGAHGDE